MVHKLFLKHNILSTIYFVINNASKKQKPQFVNSSKKM